MSVGRNIAFGLESRGQMKSQIDAQVNRLLEFLQLDGYGERMPDQLSGGQRQRVALARALAPDPKLLLLDEPLGALDAKLRTQVQVELKDIQKRTGKTFFFVTHDQEEALTMSDRIVVMNAGRVEQDGTPQELYYHPRSRFVAEFIGETNLIEGTVRDANRDAGGDATIVIDWHGMEVRGVAPSGLRPADGARVTAALRPENIVCYPQKPAEGQSVQGRLVNRVFKGSRTSAEIRVDGHDDVVLRAYMDSKQAEGLPEDGFWIGWNADHLSVLQE
jgi:spermidine/putrescine transport system ATP-binding protein